jgi:hypothetical protein
MKEFSDAFAIGCWLGMMLGLRISSGDTQTQHQSQAGSDGNYLDVRAPTSCVFCELNLVQPRT